MKIGEVKGCNPGETIEVHRELGCVKLVTGGQGKRQMIAIPLHRECMALAEMLMKARVS